MVYTVQLIRTRDDYIINSWDWPTFAEAKENKHLWEVVLKSKGAQELFYLKIEENES